MTTPPSSALPLLLWTSPFLRVYNLLNHSRAFRPSESWMPFRAPAACLRSTSAQLRQLRSVWPTDNSGRCSILGERRYGTLQCPVSAFFLFEVKISRWRQQPHFRVDTWQARWSETQELEEHRSAKEPKLSIHPTSFSKPSRTSPQRRWSLQGVQIVREPRRRFAGGLANLKLGSCTNPYSFLRPLPSTSRSLIRPPMSLRPYATDSKTPPPSQKPSINPLNFIRSLLSRSPTQNVSSFRKLLSLARPERRPLFTALGLLVISSSVSMSIPFTIGKLIDFFSASGNPSHNLPFNLSTTTASILLLSLFTLGALANAGRAFLMRTSGQRIVARLRRDTYKKALRQDVEFIEKKEGDVTSRLSVDASVVGESVTQNLSDGLRAVIMSSVGRALSLFLLLHALTIHL